MEDQLKAISQGTSTVLALKGVVLGTRLRDFLLKNRTLVSLSLEDAELEPKGWRCVSDSS